MKKYIARNYILALTAAMIMGVVLFPCAPAFADSQDSHQDQNRGQHTDHKKSEDPARQHSIYDDLNPPPTIPPITPTTTQPPSPSPSLGGTVSPSTAPVLQTQQNPEPPPPTSPKNTLGAALLPNVFKNFSWYTQNGFAGYINAILLAGGTLFATAGILLKAGIFNRYFT